jgi:Bacterial type II/III secretion system short domain
MRQLRALLFLLALAADAAAQGALEILPLRHRGAAEVIPVLRPLLEPGATLSGQSYQLFVRTSPANLAELKRVLERIDVAPRRLRISVRFDTAETRARSGVKGDVRISGRGSGASVRIEDASGSGNERVDQQLQVLEDGEAYISTGEARIYGEAATGFAVVPRVSGREVTLEVAARAERFARGGAIQGQRAASVVRGPLGAWIELTGADVTESRGERGIPLSRDRNEASARRIWLKVDEVGR